MSMNTYSIESLIFLSSEDSTLSKLSFPFLLSTLSNTVLVKGMVFHTEQEEWQLLYSSLDTQSLNFISSVYSMSDCPSILSSQRKEVKEGSFYRHYKKKDYQVLSVAYDSATQLPHVIYKALYGEEWTFARPYNMFFDEDIFEGVFQPRFAELKKP